MLLVAHMPGLVGWGQSRTAVYRIIILLCYHIKLYYHVTISHQGQVATKLNNASASVILLSHSK